MLLSLTVVVIASGTSTTQAHLVSKSKETWNLKAIAKSQNKNLTHSKYVCHNGRRGIKRWHCKSVRWLKREYRQTIKKLRPMVSMGDLSCVTCWYRVARCETTGPDWYYNGPSGFDGGLQFSPSTWLSYGGGKFAQYAYLATPMQQIAIASHMNLGHWPVCGSRY